VRGGVDSGVAAASISLLNLLMFCVCLPNTILASQVPHSQTGIANGILAMELVTGSLTGFSLFHFYFGQHVQDMYGLYLCIVVRQTVDCLKCVFSEALLTEERFDTDNYNHLDWTVCP
jgi:hypothetical protein